MLDDFINPVSSETIISTSPILIVGIASPLSYSSEFPAMSYILLVSGSTSFVAAVLFPMFPVKV